MTDTQLTRVKRAEIRISEAMRHMETTLTHLLNAKSLARSKAARAEIDKAIHELTEASWRAQQADGQIFQALNPVHDPTTVTA